MTLMQTLGFDSLTSDDLRTWGIVTATDWTAGLTQTGKFRVQLIQLSDGRYFCNADLLTEENGYYADAIAALPAAEVKGVPLTVCRALLTPIDDPEFGNGWPEWEQILGAGLGPQGAEDGWPAGSKVKHGGEVWVSTTDGNVWEPGVSGWRVDAATPAWVQPTGAHDAYAAGATVTHNGQTWTNTHGDGNVWEPGVFGWTEVV